jgi:DnaK suppressor protein
MNEEKQSSDTHIRASLLALRAELESIAATGEESAAVVELDQSKVGRLSRMDAMQAQAMAQASGQRREAMLRNITAALQRLDDGEYGLCQRCEEPINPKRLEVDPTALLCIECASRAEQ